MGDKHICFIPDQLFLMHLHMSYNAEHICKGAMLFFHVV